MHQFFAYLKFLWRSKNEHGVHSPFVYDLLKNCLYKKENKPAFKTIEAYRKAVLKDNREIEIKDFGAGSRVFKSNKRKVGDIAKNAGISLKRALLLNKLTSYLRVESALELGTSVGISSAAIATGNNLKLLTIEGCTETARIAEEYFKRFDLKNIRLVTGRFEEVAPKKAPQPPKGELKSQTPNRQPTTENQQPTTVNLQLTTDFVFFDGNHQKEATLKYFHQLLPLAHNKSVFIFDDIHWSSGMEEAWKEIREHPKTKVTIDSFYWGIVFFREEQEKEHFTIRL